MMSFAPFTVEILPPPLEADFCLPPPKNAHGSRSANPEQDNQGISSFETVQACPAGDGERPSMASTLKEKRKQLIAAFYQGQSKADEEMKAKRAKPFPCPYCHRQVSTQVSLDSHLESFHLKVRCTECPESREAFVGKSSLKRHLLKRHGREEENNVFICRECGKGLAKQANLMAHIRSFHRTQECKFCRVELTGNRMKKHLAKTHYDIPEAAAMISRCPDCSRLIDEGQLRRHYELCHEDAQCAVCKMVFQGEIKLKRHAQEVHGKSNDDDDDESTVDDGAGESKRLQDRYHCFYCNFTCRLKEQLRAHKFKAHQEGDLVEIVAEKKTPKKVGKKEKKTKRKAKKLEMTRKKMEKKRLKRVKLDQKISELKRKQEKIDTELKQAEPTMAEENNDLMFDPFSDENCSSFVQALFNSNRTFLSNNNNDDHDFLTTTTVDVTVVEPFADLDEHDYANSNYEDLFSCVKDENVMLIKKEEVVEEEIVVDDSPPPFSSPYNSTFFCETPESQRDDRVTPVLASSQEIIQPWEVHSQFGH